jgi:hypothetical protein
MHHETSAHPTSADQSADEDFPGSGGEPGAPQPDQAEGEPEDVEQA